MAKKRKRYTAEFKAEAMRLLEQRGSRSVADVATSLGVAESVLHAWKRTVVADTRHDRGESSEEELTRLRREVAELKRDRDALVKSIAVFVKDRK
jgi:transposase